MELPVWPILWPSSSFSHLETIRTIGWEWLGSASCLLCIFSSLSYFPVRSVTPQFSPTHWWAYRVHLSFPSPLTPPRVLRELRDTLRPSVGELGTNQEEMGFFFFFSSQDWDRQCCRKHEDWLNEETWILEGLEKKWEKMCHFRENRYQLEGACSIRSTFIRAANETYMNL